MPRISVPALRIGPPGSRERARRPFTAGSDPRASRQDGALHGRGARSGAQGRRTSAIDRSIVPRGPPSAAARDLKDPLKIYERIQGTSRRISSHAGPPRGKAIRSSTSCSFDGPLREFFASAAAMMLASRGIPSRLVTALRRRNGTLSRALVSGAPPACLGRGERGRPGLARSIRRSRRDPARLDARFLEEVLHEPRARSSSSTTARSRLDSLTRSASPALRDTVAARPWDRVVERVRQRAEARRISIGLLVISLAVRGFALVRRGAAALFGRGDAGACRRAASRHPDRRRRPVRPALGGALTAPSRRAASTRSDRDGGLYSQRSDRWQPPRPPEKVRDLNANESGASENSPREGATGQEGEPHDTHRLVDGPWAQSAEPSIRVFQAEAVAQGLSQRILTSRRGSSSRCW